jgi:putrescine importer
VSEWLVPVSGFLICGFIWIHLSREALVRGSLWMTAGILYGAIRSRGFRGEVASFEVPPEGPLAE